MGYALNSLGLLYVEMNDFKKAVDYFNQSLAVRREIGDKQGIAHSLKNIGNIYKKKGNITQAENASSESLRHFQDLAINWGWPW